MSSSRDPALDDWLDAQVSSDLWTTAINIFEIEMGLANLPVGQRRLRLEAAFAQVVEEDIARRIVPFDAAAARAAARLAAARRAAGRPGEWRNTQIAGVALARRATLATRNLRHFADLDTPVVDPWKAP
jgi:predicted nucleic acid-binding protein